MNFVKKLSLLIPLKMNGVGVGVFHLNLTNTVLWLSVALPPHPPVVMSGN